MATNMALKRAKKAQRRKQVVAEKRQVEALGSGLAGRASRAAKMPIQRCLLTGSLSRSGMGTLVFARGPTPDYVTLAVFLLDSFGHGIKDVMCELATGDEVANYIERARHTGPLVDVEPGYARKLLSELATWSRSLGVSPHRDFAAVERMFGDVVAGDATFQFGFKGRPLLVSGDTPSQDSANPA